MTMSFDEVLRSCRDYKPGPGGAARLANYVRQQPDEVQPTLLRNLLHNDVKFRRDEGDAPASEEYIRQLPEHANLIRSVFLETTSVAFSRSVLVDTKTGNVVNDRPIDQLPTSERLGDYRLVRQLGRGGMGLVFEAEHQRHGHRVALKTLPAVDGSTLHAFKQEFRRMAEVNHPHVIGLHVLEEDHGHWFFTMDLIQGTDF
ncbi:MAG: protein kinase, partial [Planctomycetota bacterium]